MKLSTRILQSLDAQRVRRINEIYHNLENTQYDQQHEDISKFEQSFWEEAAQRHLPQDRPIVWLDYGTGTGFVPSVVAPYLRAEDRLVCCDVSSEMLKLCEARLRHDSPACRCAFEKIDGGAIPADRGAVDVISVNSVLHHMYDLPAFATECARALKPSGLLLVAHEPNGNTSLPLFGSVVRSVARIILRPKTVVFRIAECSPLAERILRRLTSRVSAKYRRRNRMLADVARQVRRENLLDVELRGTEIQQIVDFHSQQGFDREDLFSRVFDRFDVLAFDTYGHLGFFPDGRLASAVDRCLKRRWPDTGREMCFVARLK